MSCGGAALASVGTLKEVRTDQSIGARKSSAMIEQTMYQRTRRMVEGTRFISLIRSLAQDGELARAEQSQCGHQDQGHSRSVPQLEVGKRRAINPVDDGYRGVTRTTARHDIELIESQKRAYQRH